MLFFPCGCKEIRDVFYPCELHPDIVAAQAFTLKMLCDNPASSVKWEGVGVREETGAQVLADITKKGMPFPTMKEVIVTDPNTGGAKGSKDARFDLIPSDVLWEVSEHYGKGERKYPTGEDGIPNWQKGYNWRLSVAALQRHLHAFLMGEDFDEETGSHHLVAVIWHAIAIRWFQKHGKGTDYRTVC